MPPRLRSRETRWARTIERKQCRIREREQVAERLPGDPHLGYEVDPGYACRKGKRVPPIAHAERGQGDHRQELDRRDRAERQPVNREVEDRVHDAEHDSHRGDVQPRAACRGPSNSPRPPPDGVNRCGGRDAQPGNANGRNKREQEHRERGPEIVENGAADEIRVAGQLTGSVADSAQCLHGSQPPLHVRRGWPGLPFRAKRVPAPYR
jgi:hypothetical protein